MTQIQIAKQASAAIFPEHVASPSALHVNGGLQRRLRTGTVLSADVVYRRFVDVPQGGGSLDLNHFNRASGPVLPICNATEARDSQALCSRGQIVVYKAPFRFDYKAMLLRLERRVSLGLRLLGSLRIFPQRWHEHRQRLRSRQLARRTPDRLPRLSRHLANAAGVLTLPTALGAGLQRFVLPAGRRSARSSARSISTATAMVGELLPGTTVNVPSIAA